MLAPKILVMAGSPRAGSPNGRLAALVTKELTLAEVDVTRISLADYPLPLLDGEQSAASGLPDGAVKLKRMLSAHQGVFVASPEYTASVTPILKNAIDWVTRVRESGEPAYAAFQNRVFALGCAASAAAGGGGALTALRQILELGCGALVIPEQISVGHAETAFDEMDNLKDAELTTALQDMVRRLIELASVMPRTME
jgi:chromate reductase, NAD(P)H dehydrogenase (quinone)